MKCYWKNDISQPQEKTPAQFFAEAAKRIENNPALLQDAKAQYEAAQMVINDPNASEEQKRAATNMLLSSYANLCTIFGA